MKKHLVVSILAGAIALLCVPSHATPATVYTTVEDFGGSHQGSGWSGNTAVASAAWDYDGSAVNGQANALPGGAGTAGSLAINPVGSTLGWTLLDEQYVGSFASAVLAFNPGFSGGNLPAVTGTLTYIYTLPDNAGGGAGTFVTPMMGFNMTGYWNMWDATSSDYLGIVGGKETYRANFTYSIPATTGLGYLNLMIGMNTDYAPIETFYIDDIQVEPIPEPATLSLLGLGAVTALLVRRSKNCR
jgi:hypothetical protein